ncbi:uncharacterized protein Z518_05752 [Rhinocladiella mackenziei CBS 650.93]|uniref:FAD-binding domain-containing protein n=1 Tax=Rhinocladiella mackenziei CBS 650.93 TaxID=1442369 RepID=A0A0D2IP10_9EURO|nr:uncharacterized protein Z518_05752 [Rhinocladiella mackenziei CBS 650.93]KIX04881.1 hypothetical protein Z518_05752 [Rhinocladiella mackenziei CBS 650.93]
MGDLQSARAAHVEAVVDAAGVNIEHELHIHVKTWIALAERFFCLLSHLSSPAAHGFLAQSMTLLLGDETKAVWCSTILAIYTLALNPPLSLAADYWGRKYIMIVNTFLGFIGQVMISRALNMGTLLTGFCFLGFAFGPGFAFYAVVSEIVPRKHRAWSQASVNASTGAGAIVSVLMAGALIRHGNLENYRIYWYVAAGISFAGTLGLLVGYHPPPRDLEDVLTTWQKLVSLDWIGIILISTGSVLFALGLSWANNPYGWGSAPVLVPLTTGLAMMLAFVLYEWLARKDGLAHHDLFRDRNFIISIIVIFAEGVAFFTLNNYFIFEHIAVFGIDSWDASLRFIVFLGGSIVFSIAAGAYTTFTKSLRGPLVLGLAAYVVFAALMTTLTPGSNKKASWGYATLGAFRTMATPRDMISVTTGLLTAARGLGGSVGTAINGAILNNTLKKNLATNITQAVLPLGFPAQELGTFIADLTSGNIVDLQSIPGITPEIIAAGSHAFSEAYALAFKNTWICAACFCALALIASCFVRNARSEFNAHIDAPAEAELARQQKEIDAAKVATKAQHLEQASIWQYEIARISMVGAGIQVPPNAGRVMKHLGLLDGLMKQAVEIEYLDLLRYEDGSRLLRRDCSKSLEQYGAPWLVSHREDYHMILLDAARSSGVEIRLGSMVKAIKFETTEVVLEDDSVLKADVIVGADGLWSSTRDQILGHPSPPTETGDLAYRATFTTAQLRSLNNPRINKLVEERAATLWMGPEKHTVLYPVRGGQEFNLVLLRPDNLPTGVNKAAGDLAEMGATFAGWDPILTKIISCIPTVLKWKLCSHEELPKWCKENVAILGDACHPTLPYQAQGAAMAVEDGIVLGLLLGNLSHDYSPGVARENIPSILQLYESLRKKRTSLNVKGAIANRVMYHIPDGPKQRQRNNDLKAVDWTQPCRWQWADSTYQSQLLGSDVVTDSQRGYEQWRKRENDV